IRLPLMSNLELIEAQVVEVAKETLKASENNRLTDTRDAVECAPRLRRKILTTRSLTTESSNSCGACGVRLKSTDYQQPKLLREKSKM
ncbi:hypothetical protein, partial [Pseudomonas syringae group genomosp. 3]|uniref:hypothetical protein n=1 Tax=Pseudomonas syringae group genomosp. 3 TaxID=251701 RepID=UPI001E5ED13B